MMILFWVLVISTVVLAIFFLPLWRNSTDDSVNRDSLNKSIYKNRELELKSEFEQGILSQSELDVLLIELKKTLIVDAEIDSSMMKKDPSHRIVYIVTSIVTLLCALVFYFSLGNFSKVNEWQDMLVRYDAYMTSPTEDESWLRSLSNQDLILLFRSRLHDDPNNIEGWISLGQLLTKLGAHPLAIQAMERAVQVDESSVVASLSLIQAMIVSGQVNHLKRAETLLNGFIEENPAHEGALAIKGFLYFNLQEYQIAIDVWESLINSRASRGEASGAGEKALLQRIEQAKVRLSELKDAKKGSVVEVFVSLDESLLSKISSKTSVFIVIRGDDGMPAPVAVKRITVADLPFQHQFTDGDAMIPGRTVSKMKQLFIQARVSFSGNAKPQSGDWQSNMVIWSQSTPTTAKLLINEKI